MMKNIKYRIITMILSTVLVLTTFLFIGSSSSYAYELDNKSGNPVKISYFVLCPKNSSYKDNFMDIGTKIMIYDPDYECFDTAEYSNRVINGSILDTIYSTDDKPFDIILFQFAGPYGKYMFYSTDYTDIPYLYSSIPTENYSYTDSLGTKTQQLAEYTSNNPTIRMYTYDGIENYEQLDTIEQTFMNWVKNHEKEILGESEEEIQTLIAEYEDSLSEKEKIIEELEQLPEPTVTIIDTGLSDESLADDLTEIYTEEKEKDSKQTVKWVIEGAIFIIICILAIKFLPSNKKED